MIFKSLLKNHHRVLATRVTPDQAEVLSKEIPKGKHNPLGKTFSYGVVPLTLKGQIFILTGGTSDIPVAEEARETALIMGNRVSVGYDKGVCGLHRVLKILPQLRKARVIIVIAGMDGVLPSVVGGLVKVPVIAVPTSVGYGSHFNGIAPLLTMLNSCAPGILTVNIDNGFGAAFAASRINLNLFHSMDGQ